MRKAIDLNGIVNKEIGVKCSMDLVDSEKKYGDTLDVYEGKDHNKVEILAFVSHKKRLIKIVYENEYSRVNVVKTFDDYMGHTPGNFN